IDEKKLEIEAMKSSLSVSVPNPPAVAVNQTVSPGITDDLKQLDHAERKAQPGKVSALGLPEGDINNQDEKIDFLKMGDKDSDYLKGQKTKPVSPYEVKAGSYIPAALITGINSDLPGSIVAQVTENVYDTVTGNYILIPQGAKLVGSYDSKITFGENRALVVW
ncbi:MAG: conjugal transfer protein TrbI, partial [Candidatus Omnitrophica bacterium]|nr:conjugal transfer protein TrbI [Candidatus Omnitrophota bacterium]